MNRFHESRTTISETILQINFKFEGSKAKYLKAFRDAAEPIAASAGLRWKVWPWNDEERVGGGIITPVAQLAAEAGVDRLILIHLSSFRPEHGEPELDRAYPIFPRTELAYDRMEIEF